ncbi:acyl-CoA reductase [Clostridium pasteurianum]|uniref:Acyl-CoA reductase (LuxC) n=1 Tax=Clostridium pasteurianum BC1 TaxID=86416 RepID=R4KDY7_CLOPA|nr:acyl-CoA reductase [Clostridium pasteurianum]AGK98754.1 Acyl-CoA reductase (LuxC) [Clostridium pasteurianum BC1]
MINCYLLNGCLYKKGKTFKDFDEISSSLKVNWKLLNSIPVQAIILILDEYSRRLSKDKQLIGIEGSAYLSFYFKRSNVEKLIEISLGDKKYLDEFLYKGNGKFIKAQGRGISCQWIAGNVYTLAFYSIFQSLIAKNSNLVRVPEGSIPIVLKLLKPLYDIQIIYNDKVYSSQDILKNISLVYFPSEDEFLNKSMSITADSRIIWGGKEAVDHITSLPKKTTCKDIVFGPKYSFAVFDKAAVESDRCYAYMDKLVMDVILFRQKACSSPQVLFVEKSNIALDDVVKILKKSFEKVGRRYKNILDEAQCARIINERGIYSLSLDKDICCSKGLEYTILINDDIKLEEPVGGNCIFVKQIDSIFDIDDLITHRIQTIGYAIEDKSKVLKFADIVTIYGVGRVVNIGSMNIYDSPWDGCFMINELVRWCNLGVDF